jgi:hypothetical protein
MNEVCELTEMELEAVSGGDFNFDPRINIFAPINVGIGGFAISLLGGAATGGNTGGLSFGSTSFG